MPDDDKHWRVGHRTVHAWLRPDGRWSVQLPLEPETWQAAVEHRPRGVDRLVVSRPESTESTESPALIAAGFTRDRTEQEWRIPLVGLPSRTTTSNTHRLRPVTECDPAWSASASCQRGAGPGSPR